MGKSTTARMFSKHGVAIWDADETVSRLYAKGGAGVEKIQSICPDAIVDNAVSRDVLRAWIAKDRDALRKIESVIHPLVSEDRRQFMAQAETDIVVLDIPLLFETDQESSFDLVVVASASSDVQRERVLARDGMTIGQFETILAKQTTDSEKRKRAEFIVPTDRMESAEQAVEEILEHVRKRLVDA